MDMMVRKAERMDVAAITDFQLAMAMETEQLQLDMNTVFKGVEAVFDDPSKGIYYVGESNNQLVASLLTTFEWSDWRNGTVLWIQSVYVLPGFRKMGIFRNLYEYVKSQVMIDNSLVGIRLYADVTNKEAHRVYEKLGMSADHYQTFEWMK